MATETQAILDRLKAARVVPVVRMKSATNARTAIGWLREAGLTVFEITMTIPDAPDLIRELATDPALLVGAGTVPDQATAEKCLAAGARFIVAPWVDPTLHPACMLGRAVLMLGAMTPTEVRAARAAGADVVKIFPASSAGGPGHIKALASVFPGIPLCPTGGVEPQSVGTWIAAGASFVGIGGKLVDESLVIAGNRSAILDAARAIA